MRWAQCVWTFERGREDRVTVDLDLNFLWRDRAVAVAGGQVTMRVRRLARRFRFAGDHADAVTALVIMMVADRELRR